MAKSKKIVTKTLFHVLIILFGLVMIYPVLWMIFGSFKNNREILNNSMQLLPNIWRPENYSTGWKGFGEITFSTFFANSFFVTAIATLACTISSALIAYALARVKFKGRKFWFVCMISTLMLPSQVVMIPQYIIFQKLNLVNTYVPLILPFFFGQAFFIYMMMQFIAGLPKELDEAAIIDGCSKYTIFTRIIFPLISPALITTVIIQFYWKWDDFLGPLIYLSRPEKYTASLAIKMFADASSTTDYGAMFAMSTLSLVPVFLIFLFFNRYLMEGISTTGMKD
ncbi:carbohydrate ABC transporter permease [Caproiciproducens sp. LBM24188]|nr:carbohydrate ABC transporter permease [Oscillospiraceae bacterium]HHV31868.1 carbohydrate ABC transporter permease [Clostridiales bacterium]